MLLAIDPGTDTGFAFFNPSAKLVGCGLGDPRQHDCHRIHELVRVVIEQPMIYVAQKARPNDIVQLALRAGEWAGIFKTRVPIEYVTPHTWKGNVPKDIHHARMWTKLNDLERTIVDVAAKGVAASRRHNVLDAVALGLWAVKR